LFVIDAFYYFLFFFIFGNILAKFVLDLEKGVLEEEYRIISMIK
jgi:hypothetical protein